MFNGFKRFIKKPPLPTTHPIVLTNNNSLAGLGVGVQGVSSLYKFSSGTSSIYSTGSYIGGKFSIYVLAGNKLSFDTFLALGVDAKEKKENDFIFVEKPEDIKNGSIRILDDFCLHPKIIDILEVLNKGLYWQNYSISSLYISGRMVKVSTSSNSSMGIP